MCIYVVCSAFEHPGAAMQVVCPALTAVTWETGVWATECSPCLMGHPWVGHIVMVLTLRGESQQRPHAVLPALIPVLSLSVCVS